MRPPGSRRNVTGGSERQTSDGCDVKKSYRPAPTPPPLLAPPARFAKGAAAAARPEAAPHAAMCSGWFRMEPNALSEPLSSDRPIEPKLMPASWDWDCGWAGREEPRGARERNAKGCQSPSCPTSLAIPHSYP